MGMHYRIKEYGEWQIIRAMRARREAKRLPACTVAMLFWAEAWTED